MTEFYFVRHGKTENNQLHLFNGGDVDSPLTTTGIQEVKQTGLALKDIPFAAAFSSPQLRAQKTAELILAEQHFLTKNQLTLVPEFKEITFGTWDGQPIEKMQQHPQFQNYFHAPDKFDPTTFGAESYQDLAHRGLKGLGRIQQHYPTDAVLIVSHGVLLLTLLNTLLGVPIKDIRKQSIVPNASLTIINSQSNGQFTKKCWGKTFASEKD